MKMLNFSKKVTQLLLLVLSLLVLIGVAGFAKLSAADTFSYPFAKGDYALANAPTISGQKEQSSGDLYQWYEQIFDAGVDLSQAKYLVVEYYNLAGNPGLTLGVMSHGQRFGTYVDDKPLQFLSEDGELSDISVLYASVNMGAKKGAIIIPMTSLFVVGWGDGSKGLTNCTSFFFETNAKYNWGFQMKIGEVGYYDQDMNFHKLLDLSNSVKNDKYYASNVTAAYPAEAIDTTKAKYPFAKGDYALANAPTIKAISAQTDGDSWHWHESIFDSAVDLRSAQYLAVEYKNVVGNPGLTLGIMSNGARFGTYIDGKPVYFVEEDGTVTALSVLYSSVNLGDKSGMIVIPLSSLSIVGWGDQNATLSNATSFFIETNGRYNWGFEAKVGEVAYTSGALLGSEFTKVLDLSTQLKKDKVYDSIFTALFPEAATDTTKEPVSMVYPFTTGLDNGPTLKAITAQSEGDSWHWAEHIFETPINMTSIDYVAIEYKAVAGNPGLTIGVMSNGTRFGTYIDGKPIYFLPKDGEVQELSVLYGAVNFGEGAEGMILVPLSSLSIVGWGDQNATLSNVTSFFFESNGRYNWAYEFKLGDAGYYLTDPFNKGTLIKTLDLTSGIKKANTTANVFTLEFPAASSIGSINGLHAEYPFNKGADGFNNSVAWVGTANGDANDNWQTFRADVPAFDLASASYVAIQYKVTAGAPGITFGVENSGTRYSIVGSNGEELCIMDENGDIHTACTIIYDAAAVASPAAGCLLIPARYFNYQFGNAENGKDGVTRIVLTTNSKYNWAFEILIGEIGYYTGEVVDEDFTYHRLSGLNFGTEDYRYSVVADNNENASTKYVYVTEQTVFGDTTIAYTATGKVDGSLIPWVGGANGIQTMTLDTYGKAALLLTSTGPRENADPYTAFTIFDGKHIDWTDAKGVTLWARNDSDIEVSFNLEIDVLSSHTTARGRFNITQGNRFWLYDVKTGEQTIYMTRPCVTLPVGFEGWVRIPFSAFDQADWSKTDANYGVFERQYFMTEGSYVPYMGITIYSGSYTDASFAVNMIGGYTTTPSFISSLVPVSETRKDILTLMGLAE